MIYAKYNPLRKFNLINLKKTIIENSGFSLLYSLYFLGLVLGFLSANYIFVRFNFSHYIYSEIKLLIIVLFVIFTLIFCQTLVFGLNFFGKPLLYIHTIIMGVILGIFFGNIYYYFYDKSLLKYMLIIGFAISIILTLFINIIQLSLKISHNIKSIILKDISGADSIKYLRKYLLKITLLYIFSLPVYIFVYLILQILK